jgi:type IV pilus assembly protein PilN
VNFINLMPHRHRRLEQRRRRFTTGLGLCVLAACVLVVAASFILERLQAAQMARNAVLEQAKAGLQKQEAEVRRLQGEIAALEQRQATVAGLQQQRNVPVALFNELARVAPPGLAMAVLRQSDLKLTVTGVAASNERVSDLMARLQSESAILHQPELVEMRTLNPARPARSGAAAPTVADVDSQSERMVEFTLTTVIRRDALGSEVQP